MKNISKLIATAILVIFTLQLEAINTFSKSQADSLIVTAIQDSIIPGAVLCVVEDGQIAYLQAYGHRAVWPEYETMTTNTIFDLASVSKPLGAGTAMLLLCAEGKATVDDFVEQYIPNYHADVQIRHLMTHYSGLPSYMTVAKLEKIYQDKNDKGLSICDFLIDTISNCKRPSAVGEKYRYSCLNFISLQRVVENIVGTDINTHLRSTHYQSLGLSTMGWMPNDSLLYRIAPTECIDSTCLRGRVHDPLARVMMQGISGNAGLFATAEDVAQWAIWFMNLTDETRIKGCNAGLWTDSVTTSSGIETPSCRHTGYTGTSVTVLPKEKRAVILLTNRVHPKDANSLTALRKELNALLTP